MKLLLAVTALFSCTLAKSVSQKTELILVSPTDPKGLELQCSMAPPPNEIDDLHITWGRHYHNENGHEQSEHDIFQDEDEYKNSGYEFSSDKREMKFTEKFIGNNYRNGEQLFHYSCCWDSSSDLSLRECMEFDVFDL